MVVRVVRLGTERGKEEGTHLLFGILTVVSIFVLGVYYLQVPSLVGIGRYTLTIVKSASKRKDMPPYDVEVDGIAELWFKTKADYDAYSTSPATKRLRDDGATFIGREIDFITEEQVIIS